MKTTTAVFAIVCAFFLKDVNAQTNSDSTQFKTEYTNLDEALKNPNQVYRLNLGNQKINIADSVWQQFTNLEYLSLKNDHLKQIPKGIGLLKNLKTLDLSGNDFKILPASFMGLKNLQELYLNDEKNFKLNRNIERLGKLPSLKSLHLENDNLKILPRNFYRLGRLESLFLNNNSFNKVPIEIKGLRNLKYLDFHDNNYKPNFNQLENNGFGIKINF